MMLKKIIILVSLLSSPASLFALQGIPVGDSFSSKSIGESLEYLEDKTKTLTIDQIVQETEWTVSRSESLNFGFTPSAYWFRFAVNNTGTEILDLFFEITYPLLNYVDLYVPANGGYRAIKTGNKYPFGNRDIEDKNFVFDLRTGSGPHTYYLRIESASSMIFIPVLMSQKA